jgi:ligand-binding SRPBCC domain-containing protein
VREYTLQRRQQINRPIDEVFSFFADAHNLDLLTPQWLRFRVLTPAPITMQVNAQIEYEIRWRGLSMHWWTRIEEWIPLLRFVDVQLEGPYRLWHHTHRFEPLGNGTLVEDTIRYALPLGPIGEIAHALLVRRDIEHIFDYRRKQIARLFEC